MSNTTLIAFLLMEVVLCRTEEDENDLLDFIVGMQSKRMDEQRVTLPYLPGLNTNDEDGGTNGNSLQSGVDNDDSFIEMLVRCQVHNLKILFF